jgi:hypothetical protein
VSSTKIGIICEDENDFLAVSTIIRRVLDQDANKVAFKKRFDGGCSFIIRKAERWMSELSDVGCKFIIIVHDLDLNPITNMQNDYSKLYAKLSSFNVPKDVAERLICIPVEEIEAWLWSDTRIIQELSKGNKKSHHNPSRIRKPTEELIRISRHSRSKPLYSKNALPVLAEKLNIEECSRKCESMRDLVNFSKRIAVSL